MRSAAGLLLTGLILAVIAYVVSSFSMSQPAAQGVAELIVILAVLGVASPLLVRRRR